MKSAADWRAFYRDERDRMGGDGMLACFEAAPHLELSLRNALVFPHTRLEITGAQVAAVARAIVRSRADEILAVGVLHGARAADRDEVERARAGDAVALTALRRVHGPGIAGDEGRWTEEFSLDALLELVAIAAEREHVPAPRVIRRYPFLVGADPTNLRGIDELLRLAERCPVVATTDPMHHGEGYGTPIGERRSARDPATLGFARAAIEAQLDALAAADYRGFASVAQAHRSDFRDVGPVLAHALGAPRALRFSVLDLELVDYCDALGAQDPTWVAGALVSGAR